MIIIIYKNNPYLSGWNYNLGLSPNLKHMLKAFTFTSLSFLLYFTTSNQVEKTIQVDIYLEDSVAHNFEQAQVNYAAYCAGCHGEYMKSFADQQYSRGRKKGDLLTA
ncbi:MAG: hypothetical protein ACOCXH_05365, partial [Cyclobacteriaceae bacterium]